MLDKVKKHVANIHAWLSSPKGTRFKKALPGILMILLLFSVVLLTIFHATDGFTTLVETENANIVTEKSSMTFTGYMLCNETVIPSNYGGGIYYLANDAQRVKPGDTVARVYEQSIDKSISQLTEELDGYIAVLEESLGDGHFTLGESKEVQSGISKVYLEMMRAVAQGESSAISSSLESFLILLNKMKTYSDEANADALKSLLDQYKSQRSRLESSYKGNSQTVTASNGGYYFRRTDGYEGIFTSKNIDNLTYDSFFGMVDKPGESSQNAGKILLDYKWYIAVPTVRGISDTFVQGVEYKMTFPDSGNRTFNMLLENVIYDSTESKSILLFSCGIIDPSFDYLRVQQVNIVSKNITGFRIPSGAVCELGGNSGVYILKDGMATFRKIVILYQGDGYYIVSAENTNSNDYYVYLELNDSIITDCKNMYEGKVIE